MSTDKYMQAGWFNSFGQADEVLNFGNLKKPTIKSNQVLVRLFASGVNPSDVKKRAGAFPDLLDNGAVIPNSDGAGIIEEVGSKISEDRIGERVWVYQAQFGRRFGTAAQYVAIDTSRAVLLPENISFEIGACLGIPVMTAHRCVFADDDVSKKTILITGGAGRVGNYAIQWASQAGAIVIATASNDEDKLICENAGASVVVNHRDQHLSKAILDANKGNLVDKIIDVEFGINLDVNLDVCRIGGTIVTYSSANEPNPKLPFYKMMYKDLLLRFVIVYAMPECAKILAIKDIETALINNKLQHRIGARYKLNQIAEANKLVEGGNVRGCVVLDTH